MTSARASILAIALLAALAAQAQTTTMTTINFSVPVQITGFPGSRAAVWCELLNAASQPLAPPPSRDGLRGGVGLNYVAVNGGAANANVAVAISVPRESAPLARGWRCVLATTDKYAPAKPVYEGASIPADLGVLAEVRGGL